ncbi:MraY family glycosyltransferase [Aureliella helgolandensis]|uniref:WecA-like glycosyltransferase n=1 Tax=Aureliella helgolandensis TaxID=2527968 RepID=A0A518GHF9_9BACT|nr:MraY family glycosyltransferase [Aureliella helgolandensis]QDV28026.1 WecA-like glycosyltransferase [Aureliella helgolandensis]
MTTWALLILLGAAVLPSLLIAYFTVGWVRGAAEQLGLVDKPGARKVHSVPIPLGGGLGIWAGVMGTLALGTLAVYLATHFPSLASLLPEGITAHLDGLWGKVAEIWMIAACGTVLAFLGLLDDRRGVPWWIRLGIEFAVASFCVYWQGLQLTAFIELPWLTSALSVLWIVALINSFNMLDNMDGLSGGVAAISSTMLAMMLLSTSTSSSGQPQIFVAAMLLVLVGALLGFLRHNWAPATIFMGDAGSYFIGFWIAVATLLATYAGYQGATPHAVVAPLIVMAIPLYDMTSVILIRLREGRSPFEADKRHFSHRLTDLGMTKKQAVLTIYVATTTCALSALLLPRVDAWGAMLIVISTCLTLSLVRILESVGRPPAGDQQ